MKKKHELCLGCTVTSHFHLKIAERIGETDGTKALDRNEKALEKEKYVSRGPIVRLLCDVRVSGI